MNRILFSLLITYFTQSVFAQTTEWEPFVVGGVATPLVWERMNMDARIPTAFRLQAGMVKEKGFYIAGETNFHFTQPDGDYGDEPEYHKCTDKKKYNYWSIQAGPVFRLNPNFMIYYGGGFGRSIQLLKTEDGLWMWSHDHHFLSGILLETNFGVMYRIKPFVVSAGFSVGLADVQWYTTGRIGFGVMF